MADISAGVTMPGRGMAHLWRAVVKQKHQPMVLLNVWLALLTSLFEGDENE